jgi:protein required for attachment to host cells
MRSLVLVTESWSLMDRLQIKEGAWVVVCDGAKAIVLENIGDHAYPDLRMREAEEQPDRPTHEIGTDAPGRAINSVGRIGSAVEQTDFHDESEKTFLTDLVRRLDKALTERETSSLIIVAPPRALGMLRNAYTSQVRKAVAAEVDKDLVALPIVDIERHLLGKKHKR